MARDSGDRSGGPQRRAGRSECRHHRCLPGCHFARLSLLHCVTLTSQWPMPPAAVRGESAPAHSNQHSSPATDPAPVLWRPVVSCVALWWGSVWPGGGCETRNRRTSDKVLYSHCRILYSTVWYCISYCTVSFAPPAFILKGFPGLASLGNKGLPLGARLRPCTACG